LSGAPEGQTGIGRYGVRSLPVGLAKAYKGPEFAAELQQLVDGLKTSERHAL